MDNKEWAKFLVDNPDCYDEYDGIVDLYCRAVAKKLRKYYDIYVDANRFISSKRTLVENWDWFRDNVVKPITGTDLREFQLWQAFESLSCYGIRFEEPDTIKSYKHSLNNVIYLLRYSVLERLDADLGQVHKTIEKMGLPFDVSHFSYMPVPDLPGVSIRKFKDGRYQLKGVSEKALKTVKYICELSQRQLPHNFKEAEYRVRR